MSLTLPSDASANPSRPESLSTAGALEQNCPTTRVSAVVSYNDRTSAPIISSFENCCTKDAQREQAREANVSATVCSPAALATSFRSDETVSSLHAEGDGNSLSSEPYLPRDNDIQSPNKEVVSEPDSFVQDRNANTSGNASCLKNLISHTSFNQLSEPNSSKTSPISITSPSAGRGTLSQSEFFELAIGQRLPDPVPKRMKTNSDDYKYSNNVDNIIKRVADIVMVLAGLGEIRAQRPPTFIEKELQAEAYASLGFLVQNLAPKDVVGKKSIENLIEELGLRRTEKKVELITTSAITEMQGADTDKSEQSQEAIAELSTPVASVPNNVKEPELHDSMIPEPVISYPQPGPPTPTGLFLEEAILGQVEDKISIPSSVNVLTPDSSSTGAVQTLVEARGGRFTHKQLTQAMQQWIQSNSYTGQPLLNPPKPYMSVPIPCELCKVIVNDTSSVLICDVCERAYHLKCMQPYQFKGIPKGDWHCPRCVIENQGRPQTPKYGPVKLGSTFASSLGRSTGGFQEVERNSTRAQAQGTLSQQPINASSGPAALAVGKIQTEGTNKQAGKKDFVKDVVWPKNVDDGVTDRPSELPGQMVMEGRSTSQNAGKSFTTSLDRTQAELQHPSTVNVGQPLNQTTLQRASRLQSGDHLTHSRSQLNWQPNAYFQTLSQSRSELLETHKAVDVGKLSSRVAKGSGQGGSLNNFGEDIDQFGVEWLGDVMHSNEGKDFYLACRVGGFVYKLQDYALFRPETPDIPPYIAKLQGLWEDNTTGSKWVRVNWCYYPTDIPMMVGRPSNPEANEVYESNHGDNNLVGSIQGPCLVLRPDKYFKEIERRREILRSGNTSEGLFPIFLCRWLYDAPRGVFRPATDIPPII